QFAGTQRQNSAFTNRVTYAVHVTWLPAASEAKLLTTKTGIDPTSAKYMVLVATKVREQYDKGQCVNVVSTRDLKAWAREVMRETKRSGIDHTDTAYWSQVVAPSALPSFLELIEDEATAKMILGFIDTVR
ncbi:MAG: hypothetical protein GF414_04395, partial [Candidatus Altiarchaeales archaeon]|nr:hypothetical protein [Candidatus Altiarchaeales archaeon]